MHSKNQYKQMVVYVEACESGSMFADLLPTDINGKYVWNGDVVTSHISEMQNAKCIVNIAAKV